MPGCGGLRKTPTVDPQRRKGKRGGARVIYLYVPEVKWFFMLDGYDKDEQDDLTPAEKNVLAQRTGEFKRSAVAALKRKTASSRRRKP